MSNCPAPDEKESPVSAALAPLEAPLRDPYVRWRAFAAGLSAPRRTVTPRRAWAFAAQGAWTRNR